MRNHPILLALLATCGISSAYAQPAPMTAAQASAPMTDGPQPYTQIIQSSSMPANVHDNLIVNLDGLGGGVLGGLYAQRALTIGCSKTGYPLSTATGEIDCIATTGRESGPGDLNGSNVDVANLGGGNVNVGYGISTSLDATGTTPSHQVSVTIGSVQYGAAVYGFETTNGVGTGWAAFSGQSVLNAPWSYLLLGSANGVTYFDIDGLGNIYNPKGVYYGYSQNLTGDSYVGGVETVIQHPVENINKNTTLAITDCDKLIRATGPLTITVVPGIPYGCVVRVEQMTTAQVYLAGYKMTPEEYVASGTPLYQMAGQFARGLIEIDSPTSFLVSGNVR